MPVSIIPSRLVLFADQIETEQTACVFSPAQMPTRRSMLLTGSRRQRGQVMARQSMRATFGQRWTARVQGQPLLRS